MISKHISYKEAVYSRTAQRRDIYNHPENDQADNMRLIAEQVFEPLRSWVGGPIKINSFFRSPELNTAIGGSTKSQHCHGQAIDLDDTFGRATNAEMYEFIKENLDFIGPPTQDRKGSKTCSAIRRMLSAWSFSG